MFISDVLAVHYNSQVLDEKGAGHGKDQAVRLLYRRIPELADRIGRYGFSKRE